MKQISKYVSGALIVLGFLAGVVSCNKDLGNYDYRDISMVDSIKGISDLHRASSGDMLRITPQLVFSGSKNKDDFRYTWYYREGKVEVNEGKWIVLHEGPELNVAVEGPIGTPDKEYTLAFEIVNKITDIVYRKVFKLRVESPYARGFAALCETETGFDIDMIALSPESELHKYKNILETTNSALRRQGVKPYDIVTSSDRYAPNPFAVLDSEYTLFVLTDQYTTRLNPGDYSWDPSYDVSNIVAKNSYLDVEYIKKDKPIIAKKMVRGTPTYRDDRFGNRVAAVRLYMYHEEPDPEDNTKTIGNWYFYNDYMYVNLFSVQMNGLRSADSKLNGKRFEPSPYVSALTESVMYFDTTENKFMCGIANWQQGTNSSLTYYAEPIPTEPDNALYKLNDPNEGLLYMGSIAGGGSGMIHNGFAILKQSDGSHKYIEFGNGPGMILWSHPSSTIRKRVSSFSAGSKIAEAKFIVRPDADADTPFLYYVTNDNKVWVADLSAATAVETEITSSVIKDGYSEITVFKHTMPESGQIGGAAETALAVATFDPTKSKDDGGKLEFFSISNRSTGELALTKYPDTPRGEDEYQVDMSWTGLGRIVGLSYKQK
jgi:hypothetical protein